MELRIKTLTPLWTGNIYRKVDRIHETGILGSLRWWCEAIVRGLGGKVCDPSQGKCGFDSEKYRSSSGRNEPQRLRDAGLCDVCQIFGATGWRRRFQLKIVDETRQKKSSPTKISAQRYNSIRNRTPTWWFSDHPRSGNLTILIQTLDESLAPEVCGGLIQFIADWGSLGAKAQMGFGVVDLKDSRVDARPFYDRVTATAGGREYPTLPSLRNLFLASLELEDTGDEVTFNLKYDLRRLFAKHKRLRHFIMGTVGGQRMASKIKMSRPHGNALRLWGWVPEKARPYQKSWDRNRVLDVIYKHANENYTLKAWREMNSIRDKKTPNTDSPKAFLRSLLNLEEVDDAA